MFEKWIRIQNRKIQLEVLNRISHYLSNNELVSVMEAVGSGREIIDAHIERGLFEKYRVDIFRVRQIVTDRFPDEVID